MRRLTTILAAAIAALLWTASPAGAAFGLHDVDVTFTGPEGEIVTQAGAHPFQMTTSFRVNSIDTGKGGEQPEEPVRTVHVDLMSGFAAAPSAVPTCSAADFLTRTDIGGAALSGCPDSAAIGVIANQLANEESKATTHSALYNLEPPPGVTARFGFWAAGVPVEIDGGMNEEPPYQLFGEASNISQIVEVVGSSLTLWGVPANKEHDPLRGRCIDIEGNSNGNCPAVAAEAPFITIPRACDGPLVSHYFALSWPKLPEVLSSEDSGEIITHDDLGNPKGMVGCGSLGFLPTLSAQPTARTAASPSGMDISLHFDNEGLINPSGEANSDLKKAVVTLPEGVTINPSQAEGLATCSEAQLARETASSQFGAGCPAESKIGTVEVETPLLEKEVFKGSLFVATPYENPFGTPETPSGSLLALYMTIKSPERGVGLTLAGKVEPDPATGQLVTTFGGDGQVLPQVPFSDFRVHLREGGRSPLITPNRCGDLTTEMLLTPTADPDHPFTAASTFHLEHGVGGGPCPTGGTPPFEPGFAAGTLTNGAATHSPFLMRLTRRDGDQDLTKFSSTLPPGVLASLVGLDKCSDAAIAAARGRTGPNGGHEELASPSCPANSKIGTTVAGAGVGSQLTYVPGSLYLAGPYNGAPLSVVSITPGVAGPFDVGTVVVRVALGFNPLTAEAQADGSRSDPIPHILRGIPLAVRDLQVNVDRPNWIFNPTSCRQSSTRATIFGSAANLFDPADDIPISRTARFQAADCLALPFGPGLALKLKGGTKRGDHPALTATYTARKGDANLDDLSLLFPRSAFVENANFRTICTRKDYAAHNCPKGSIYGHVTAYTPVLEEPLSGPVYLRSSDNPLPDVVLVLHGIVDAEVPIKVDSFKQRLRTTVKNSPDVPVSKVVVKMQGGNKGLFVNSKNLCSSTNRAELDLTAHSTKKLKLNPLVKPTGCKSGGKKHKRSRH
jgi:hypothetical protein